MCNSEEMMFFLFTVKHGANLSSSLLNQLGFSGMGRLCIEAMESDLITETERGYKLTEHGILYLENQNNKLGRKGLDREIAKLPSALCPKISMDTQTVEKPLFCVKQNRGSLRIEEK